MLLIYIETINEEFNFEMNCTNISLRIEYTRIREKLIGMALDHTYIYVILNLQITEKTKNLKDL